MKERKYPPIPEPPEPQLVIIKGGGGSPVPFLLFGFVLFVIVIMSLIATSSGCG